jgi:3-oxoacyl-[acyl-carrier-protein] synthase-3
MNGGEVFNFSISEEPESINNILSYSNSKIEDIDYIVFHQANKYIISNIARRLKISTEKTPMTTVEKYGNQSSASIPCTINDVLGEELVSESKNVILSGFGVGLSWASCMTKLKLDYCPKVKIYKDD